VISCRDHTKGVRPTCWVRRERPGVGDAWLLPAPLKPENHVDTGRPVEPRDIADLMDAIHRAGLTWSTHRMDKSGRVSTASAARAGLPSGERQPCTDSYLIFFGE
jgi:hypothetical protein